jgi:hypothetical protein
MVFSLAGFFVGPTFVCHTDRSILRVSVSLTCSPKFSPAKS